MENQALTFCSSQQEGNLDPITKDPQYLKIYIKKKYIIQWGMRGVRLLGRKNHLLIKVPNSFLGFDLENKQSTKFKSNLGEDLLYKIHLYFIYYLYLETSILNFLKLLDDAFILSFPRKIFSQLKSNYKLVN